MGRRKLIDDRERLTMLLQAICAHPWARTDLLQSQSGLRQGEFEETVWLASRYRLITPATIRGLGHTPARYGPTRAGSERVGMLHSEQQLHKTRLAALKLDYARSLLNKWFAQPGTVWAMSPFVLPARALRPGGVHKTGSHGYAGQPYRALHIEGLACVRFTATDYRNVAVIVDSGNLRPEWLRQQLRSVHAWRRRPEFLREGNTYFPVLAVVTTDHHRLMQITQHWRETGHDGDWLGPLRLTTVDGLRDDLWWNESGRLTTMWGGIVPCAKPSRRPVASFMGWWGEAAQSEIEANQPAESLKHTPTPRGVGFTKDELLRLLDIHSTISLKSRELLDRIGQYPLATEDDLAAIMGYSDRHVRASLAELRSLNLSKVEDEGKGNVLTWLGLCLLAAQVGFPPVEYARLRGWPLRRTVTGLDYAIGWFDTVRTHTRLVIDFLVGICRYGPPRLSLLRWDHVQCLFELPERTPPGQDARQKTLKTVVPDATGVVKVTDSAERCSELAFWLEVDRDSAHGQELADKLARYYQLGGTWDGLRGNLPRLLILVERGGEGRLQSLRRRLQAFNEQYRTQLDVRLARADLLADEHGRLNPLKRAWRTVQASEFVSPFEG